MHWLSPKSTSTHTFTTWLPGLEVCTSLCNSSIRYLGFLIFLKALSQRNTFRVQAGPNQSKNTKIILYVTITLLSLPMFLNSISQYNTWEERSDPLKVTILRSSCITPLCYSFPQHFVILCMAPKVGSIQCRNTRIILYSTVPIQHRITLYSTVPIQYRITLYSTVPIQYTNTRITLYSTVPIQYTNTRTSCIAPFSSSFTPFAWRYSVTDDSLAVCSADGYEEACEEEMASAMPLVLIFLSQFVLGIGSTLYYALGQPYLDDNVKKTQTPLLLGINQWHVTWYSCNTWRLPKSQKIVGFYRLWMFVNLFTKACQLAVIWASWIQLPLSQRFLSSLTNIPFLFFSFLILLALCFIPSFLSLIFLSFLALPQSQCSPFFPSPLWQKRPVFIILKMPARNKITGQQCVMFYVHCVFFLNKPSIVYQRHNIRSNMPPC